MSIQPNTPHTARLISPQPSTFLKLPQQEEEYFYLL